MFQDIKSSLQQLYLEDQRPWLVGFSGDVGPSSARPGPKALRPYNNAVMSIPAEQRKKPISILCTDTRVEIPAIAEMIAGTLRRCRKCSEQNSLNIDANPVAPGFSPAPNVFGNRICEGWRLGEPKGAGLKPGATKNESFWVNIIGRGYPPPNRTFRWCTQRMKIDPVNALVKQRVGIRCSGDLRSPTGGRRPPLQTGARRAESSTRAQTMAARQTRNGLNRHPDLPRVWVSNPIEFLSTEEVWAYLLQKPVTFGILHGPTSQI
jgi:DNA sulfur modification protein DndC